MKLKNASCIRIQSITAAKTIYPKHNTKQRIEAEKHGNEKIMYKLMNNVVYGKTIENLRNRFNMRIVSNEKYHLK